MGWIWLSIVTLALGTLMSYRSVPPLLQGLQNLAPFEYNELGCPDASELFARFPNGLQLRFAWFVLRGEAYRLTHGSARAAAVFAWLGYVFTFIGAAGFFFAASQAE